MQTKAPNRYSTQRKHDQYGVYNWFKKHKGISNVEIINEVVYVFCEQNGFNDLKKNVNMKMYTFCSNRFDKFSSFAGKYLKDNNYLN